MEYRLENTKGKEKLHRKCLKHVAKRCKRRVNSQGKWTRKGDGGNRPSSEVTTFREEGARRDTLVCGLYGRSEPSY